MFLSRSVSVLDPLVGHYCADLESPEPSRRFDLGELGNDEKQ
jgi:hypothetical protein